MKIPHFQSPTDTLILWAERQMTEARQPLLKFAEALTDNYLAMVPEDRRTCPLDEIPIDGSVDDHYRIQKKNALAVERWVKGTIKLPLEILDAWISTLQGEYRAGCVADLLERHNMTAVPAIDRADAATFAQTMHTTADMIGALACIVADGVVDEQDREDIIRARQQMRILKGQMAGWERAFDTVLDEPR
ncbi:hypothetical protein PWG14_20710 (plasmid) [Chromobacterium amazonense]|uniref:hypothetical protein n=1 Tax=Chromobacterium amazonense TaxID=1382803 RepID=UPI00237D58AD|nr:hypothetical protein [Chromobacterium amazonense]MDE1714913.1 hypothetical protein [Chromobacterium amazonense]